jgi:polar amino acid transport system substrate-binding protein
MATEPLQWVYGHFPPYIYMGQDFKPYGFHADIIKSILKHADIEYQPVFVPNRRARKMVNDGFVPLAMAPLVALKNPDDFHISPNIVVKIDLHTYWIGKQKPVTKSSDLNGESVVLITSFNYSGLRDYIEDPTNKVKLAVEVENHKRALSALDKGRATYMLGYKEPVDLMQLEMNVQNLNSYPLLQTNNHLFINKSVKNSRQIMDKLEQAYFELYIRPFDDDSVKNSHLN